MRIPNCIWYPVMGCPHDECMGCRLSMELTCTVHMEHDEFIVGRLFYLYSLDYGNKPVYKAAFVNTEPARRYLRRLLATVGYNYKPACGIYGNAHKE